MTTADRVEDVAFEAFSLLCALGRAATPGIVSKQSGIASKSELVFRWGSWPRRRLTWLCNKPIHSAKTANQLWPLFVLAVTFFQRKTTDRQAGWLIPPRDRIV